MAPRNTTVTAAVDNDFLKIVGNNVDNQAENKVHNKFRI